MRNIFGRQRPNSVRLGVELTSTPCDRSLVAGEFKFAVGRWSLATKKRSVEIRLKANLHAANIERAAASDRQRLSAIQSPCSERMLAPIV